jgi:hypothetical protein
MIGVVADPTELDIACEFFELFKTNWEVAVPTRKYSAILSTRECTGQFQADAYFEYGTATQSWEREVTTGVERLAGPTEVSWREFGFPIYTGVAVFESESDGITLRVDGKRVDCCRRSGTRVDYRIGYDLFREIAHLLAVGQPARWSTVPTLELHIEVLRNLLLDAGISFAEIPPRPFGHEFVCCLTHDVDFYGIRRHRLDRTLAGFVVRASVGTAADLVRGRRRLSEALWNWRAILWLPLIFLRVMRDIWRPFDDYARVEKGLPSTFFLIPFKDSPGLAPDGTINPVRAVAYDVRDISEDVKCAAARGAEMAVHGIDSWHDARRGRAEIAQLESVIRHRPSGVRMHWLYFSADSARHLERAGFDYDSTWGYNDAVGYRAGTSQVFRLPGAERLLELPLSIMDTALLYRGRMNLSMKQALRVCRELLAYARRMGGTVVINWHDRSLAPERLWGRCYMQILQELADTYRPWFATAGQAVTWFRWRRSFRFVSDGGCEVRIESAAPCPGPPAVVLIYRPRRASPPAIEELSCDGRTALTISV